jgi:hypothetical protein
MRLLIYALVAVVASGLSAWGAPWNIPLVIIGSVAIGRLAAIDAEKSA